MGFWSTSSTGSAPSPNTSKCDTIPNSVECFYDIFQKIDDKVLQTLVRPTNITVKNLVMMVTLVGEDKLVEEYKQFVNILNKDVLLVFDKLILYELKQEAQNFTLNDMIELVEQCKGKSSQNMLVKKLWTAAKFAEVTSFSVGIAEHLQQQQMGGKQTNKSTPRKKTIKTKSSSKNTSQKKNKKT